MSVEILINFTPRETRTAVVENGVLQEVYIERCGQHGLVGNLYKGRVNRVLPGMQAAFVDIGLDRAAFLHASDVRPREMNEAGVECERREPETINELLVEGQEILVQVVKDPLGTKGARLTTHASLPSRTLVFLPKICCAGISQRIENEEERERLRTIIRAAMEEKKEGGFIVRTAGEGVAEEELKREIDFLHQLWDEIKQNAARASAPSLVHSDLPLALRTLRDLLRDEVERVRIDSKQVLTEAKDFAQRFAPELEARIEAYDGERPIFDLYGVEDEIQRALESKVPLKSGGYLVIDQTEAMTTIDVNTGGYVGHRNLEETIFKTNLEAAQAIARQLRLRNLGGIIILDFIDMELEEHRDQVLRTLEKHLEQDHARTHVCGVSPLGLVEMTRKRTRESLEHVLCAPCPTCNGRGTLKTPETVVYEVFRDILRLKRQYESGEFLVLASQSVIDLLLDEESTSLAELQEFIGRPVRLQVETLYTQEQFDVVPV
ncbi:MAG: ribonuclease G [Gammaproteobacteria bacterium]